MVNHNSEAREQGLDKILPNIAIQLRSPLCMIYTGVQRLLEEGAPGAEQMNQAYHQMLRLVGNLSAAEMLGDAPYMPGMQNGDIAALCAALSEHLHPLIESVGIQFRYTSNVVQHIIMFDRSKIERMLLNLISNAIKFTPPGKSITLSLQVTDKDVRLSVSDTGCGIPADKLDAVFERYLHSNFMDLPPHGLGLGLSVCRAIAQAHNGRIFLESQVDKGTKVTVALPNEQNMNLLVRDEERFDYAGGFNRILMELSDALPSSEFGFDA